MRFEMRRIDHNSLLLALPLQRTQNTIECAEATRAHEAIIKVLVWTVSFRRVPPLQAMADNISGPAYNAPIIRVWNPMCERKERRDVGHLLFIE